MGLLPDTLVALDAAGRPLDRERGFHRVDARSAEGRALSEADWDAIICANVDALAEALRAADILPEDSALRVLGCQVDCVDVLLAEVPRGPEDGDASQDSLHWGEPRRLVLVEDKLVRNPEARRKVLAQVLEYAQRAQSWRVAELCASKELAPHAPWLSKHQHQIEAMLTQGELLLIIAGDEINSDLLRLARRFSSRSDPLSLEELCLVALTVYRRGDERLFVPHVVSAVERHHRELAIRVTVQDAAGARVAAKVERDLEAEVASAQRGAPPVNVDAEAFLERVKLRLASELARPGSPYEVTSKVRKALMYWFEDEDDGAVRFKVHFGGYARDTWSPIQVGLYVESARQETWRARAQTALAAGQLPVGTKVQVSGKQTVMALKEFRWEVPAQLSDELVEEVATTLIRFEEVFGKR